MNKLRFLISITLTTGLIYFLNVKTGTIPPLGKLFDPFHGFWQNAESKGIQFPTTLELKELEGKVTVRFEDNLIPHIFATSEHDLYFTQGYINARYRLWQMHFLTSVASGRVSEFIGEQAVQFDRMQRRKGLMYGAENSLKELEKNEKYYSVVKAYTDGVNALIGSLKYSSYPVEYKILDYKPEEWSPVKSVLLLKYMADDLAGADDDLENTNAVLLFGKQRFDFLFPSITEENDPIIPVGTKWNFKPVEVKTPNNWEIKKQYTNNTLPDPEKGLGSNNWAISGSKTKSGYPILCNDPHLRLSFPAIWFAQQLQCPGLNVFGVSIPGLPGILLGFNDSIAWGLTNSPRDVRDWYQITFKDQDRNEYLYEGKWLKTSKRIEHILARGGKNFTDTVIYTHYGPVVYDRTFMGDTGRVNYALKWMAHTSSQEVSLLYEINRSANISDMINAAKLFECPPQNIAIAAKNGDIGILVEGKFPLKWKDQGRFLMDGSDPEYEWQGFVPKEQNARIINPVRGFVSSANQRPFDETYPYYYYNESEEHFRNRRINKLLSEMKNITPEDMMKMQNDTYSLLASEMLPVMLDTVVVSKDNSEQKAMLEELRKWDYYCKPGIKAPSYFQVWYYFLEHLTWDEFEQKVSLPYPDEYQLSYMLRKFPHDSIFDIHKTEQVENEIDIIRESFKLAADSITHWKAIRKEEPVWSKFKSTRIQHMVPQFSAFSLYDINVGGFEHIVNASGKTWGPSWRLIAELGEKTEAWGIYAGGQSGNPGSPYYMSFIDQWANGEYFKINFIKDQEEAISLKNGKLVELLNTN
jgi:penicillin amidase